jgi:hypothetical protein
LQRFEVGDESVSTANTETDPTVDEQTVEPIEQERGVEANLAAPSQGEDGQLSVRRLDAAHAPA